MEYWPRRCLPKATIVLQEFLLDNWQGRCWHYFLHTCSSPSQLLHYRLYQSVDSFKCTSLTCRDLPQVMQSISWEKKLRSFILRHIVTAQGDFPLPISQDKTNGSQMWECQTTLENTTVGNGNMIRSAAMWSWSDSISAMVLISVHVTFLYFSVLYKH